MAVILMKTIVITLVVTCIAWISAKSTKCGYDSCNLGQPNILNVHLISHTHDDVGWLKTVDQYFYGYKDNIQGAGVQYILDTVISGLLDNPNRKFSYVEIAYFYRWWQQQNDNVKGKVKVLVEEGRLQFLLGGWCMNDEATTHYTAIIDQTSLGLDFLNKTFGECGRPLASWQIDPFGHSIEQANLFAIMGFDSLFFMRLDYRDKDQRIATKNMEFIQKGTFLSSKLKNELFTNVLFDSYCTPPGFCFDDKCSDDPIMDDPTLHDYNVQKRVDEFASYVLKQSKAYQTNHVLILMGCDFQFQNAYHNFVNIDKLIYHVNRLRKDINVFYSTPACYTLAVNKAGKVLKVKTTDFFPYASGPNSFWTGYFTSRPALKGFVRYSNNVFQICKQIQVLSQQNQVELNRKVKSMAMKMGVLQHHDAVSGTEKQEVAFDYAQRLSDGLRDCENVINSSLSKLISKDNINYNFILCNLLNISYCSVSDNIGYTKVLTIVLYNPLGTVRTEWNRVPVKVLPGDEYKVALSNGSVVNSQLIPITNRTLSIPERPKESSANFDLIFPSVIPPMGFVSFTIFRSKKSGANKQKSIVKNIISKENIIIENPYLKLTYNNNGFLMNIFNKISKIDVNITLDLRFYFSYQENGQKSGAYIFRPTTNESIAITKSPKLTIIKGNLVTEIHQLFSEWGTLVTRLYNDSNKLETEWTVGPIPVEDSKGKEIVIQYQTNLETEDFFFTDSNGRQIISRQINKRYDYNFTQTEPIAGNFYPIVSHAFLAEIKNKDKKKAFVVHVDRAQGVGAYKNGMMEIMLHRRTLFDDDFGVGEPLNETGADKKGLIVRGKHSLHFDYIDNIYNDMRIESLNLFSKPIMIFSTNTNISKIDNYSSIKENLPHGINLLSLENHFNLQDEIDYQIIRVENILYLPSSLLKLDFKKIFKSINFIEIIELNLSANQFLKDVKRLHWKTSFQYHAFSQLKDLEIELLPGQIRTFKVVFKGV